MPAPSGAHRLMSRPHTLQVPHGYDLYAQYGQPPMEDMEQLTVYSPSPSSIEAKQNRPARIDKWTHDVQPGAARAELNAAGASVGALSAAWSDVSSDPTAVADEYGHATHPRKPTGRSSRDPLPRPQSYPHLALAPRDAPTAALAQGLPSPGVEHGYPTSRADTALRQGMQGQRQPSRHSAREAYLNEALQLPLDMLTATDRRKSPLRESMRPRSSTPMMGSGRMSTLLNRVRSSASLNGGGSDRPTRPADTGASGPARAEMAIQAKPAPQVAQQSQAGDRTSRSTSANAARPAANSGPARTALIPAPPLRSSPKTSSKGRNPSSASSQDGQQLQVPAVGATPEPPSRETRLSISGQGTPPRSTAGSRQRPPSEQNSQKTASVAPSLPLLPPLPSTADSQTHTMVHDFEQATRHLGRGQQSKEELVLLSGVPLDLMDQNSDSLVLKIPERRGPLQVSFSWLAPRRTRILTDDERAVLRAEVERTAPQLASQSLGGQRSVSAPVKSRRPEERAREADSGHHGASAQQPLHTSEAAYVLPPIAGGIAGGAYLGIDPNQHHTQGYPPEAFTVMPYQTETQPQGHMSQGNRQGYQQGSQTGQDAQHNQQVGQQTQQQSYQQGQQQGYQQGQQQGQQRGQQQGYQHGQQQEQQQGQQQGQHGMPSATPIAQQYARSSEYYEPQQAAIQMPVPQINQRPVQQNLDDPYGALALPYGDQHQQQAMQQGYMQGDQAAYDQAAYDEQAQWAMLNGSYDPGMMGMQSGGLDPAMMGMHGSGHYYLPPMSPYPAGYADSGMSYPPVAVAPVAAAPRPRGQSSLYPPSVPKSKASSAGRVASTPPSSNTIWRKLWPFKKEESAPVQAPVRRSNTSASAKKVDFSQPRTPRTARSMPYSGQNAQNPRTPYVPYSAQGQQRMQSQGQPPPMPGRQSMPPMQNSRPMDPQQQLQMQQQLLPQHQLLQWQPMHPAQPRPRKTPAAPIPDKKKRDAEKAERKQRRKEKREAREKAGKPAKKISKKHSRPNVKDSTKA